MLRGMTAQANHAKQQVARNAKDLDQEHFEPHPAKAANKAANKSKAGAAGKKQKPMSSQKPGPAPDWLLTHQPAPQQVQQLPMETCSLSGLHA